MNSPDDLSTQGDSGSVEPIKLTARQVFEAPAVKSFIIANSALYVGLMLQAATLGKHIYDITGREIDIGWLGLAEFLPVALLVFVTGSVADRYNRRRVAVTAMSGELLCALALVF